MTTEQIVQDWIGNRISLPDVIRFIKNNGAWEVKNDGLNEPNTRRFVLDNYEFVWQTGKNQELEIIFE